MKILVLSSGSYKSPLALRVVALSKHLGKRGNTVLLMAPSADKYNKFTPDKHPKLPFTQVIQPWQPTTKSAMFNLVPYILSSLVALLSHRVDAIYLCKPTPITILGLLPRVLFGTPVILDLDDLGSEVMKSQGQSILQYKLVAWCEKIAARYASGIVVASTYLEELVKTEYPDKPLVVIPNGVDPDDYVATNKIQPRNAVYYFGVLNRLSLIEILLYALPKVIETIPDTIITIAGGGSALPEARQIVERLGLSASVTFTDWIPFLDIQKYVQPGDVGVCYQPDTPTVRAASIMKVFQYMAMSTVPVVSEVGDLPIYVQHGRIGKVVPAGDDPKTLALTLIEVLKDTNNRAKMASLARQVAETDYSWSSRTQLLDEFIRTVKGSK
ncbi:MAG TPA: glycosyltransferase [Patescibacteria group bacterium]|jgi:glycosyltransferase involved in cell wall biosynthesis|nr:glycosyltransferase [Patescibacteria group bacterium]